MDLTKEGDLGNQKHQEKEKQTEITFEGILKKVGEFGPYQLTVFLLISLSDITASLAAQFFIFGAANPGFACVVDENLNFSDIYKDGQFIPPAENNTQYAVDECEVGEQSCVKRFYSTEFTSIITEVSLLMVNLLHQLRITISILLMNVKLMNSHVSNAFTQRNSHLSSRR